VGTVGEVLTHPALQAIVVLCTAQKGKEQKKGSKELLHKVWVIE
jgi:hypothetical protein